MQIAHITIWTTKKQDTVKFYQTYCGLKVMRELGDHITFLADCEGGTCIEIVSDPEKAAKTENISIGFTVDDAVNYRNQLLQAGLQVSDIISPQPSVNFFFAKDPNGVDIQFVG